MDKNKNKDSFLKGALILAAAGVIVKLMGGFFRIPLGNLIGAEGMGYYQAVYPVYTLFLTLATAGFPTALAKLVSEKIALGDDRGAYKIFKVSFTVLSITGFLAFLVFFFGAKFIVTDILNNPNAYYAMLAIAPALLFVPVMSSYRGYFQGRQEMSYIATSQIAEQFFRVVLGIALAYLFMKIQGPAMGAAGAITGATIGSVAAITYLVWVYIKKNKEFKSSIDSSSKVPQDSTRKILKSLLFVAVPITIGACVGPLVNMIDSVIVIRRLEVAGFPYLEANTLFGQLTGMALSIVNLPSIITLSLGMSLVPAISQLYAVKDTEGVKLEIKSALKIAIYIVLPAAFGLASLSTPIMQLLYPGEPASIGHLLLVLSPAVIFLGLIQTMNGILQGMGKPIIPVICLLVGVVFKVAISYTLTAVPSVNIFGSALGTVSAYVITGILELIFIKKISKVELSVSEYLFKPLLMVVIMSITVIIGFNLTSAVLGSKLATLVSIGIGGLVYAILIFRLGAITKDEILKMPKGQKICSLLAKMKLVK